MFIEWLEQMKPKGTPKTGFADLFPKTIKLEERVNES